MGSGGIKRKRRPHLPKVPEGVDQRGTVPLGQDPGVGPYGPRAQILAAGAVARALRAGTPGQRKVAFVLFAVMAISFLLAAAAALFSR
jgi:hypothetical protein